MKAVKLVCVGLMTISVFDVFYAFQTSKAEKEHSQQDHFHVQVLEVLDDEHATVKQISIECLPGSRIRVASNKKKGGALSTVAGRPQDNGDISNLSLTVFADHIEWESEGVDALKFLLALKGNSGGAGLSEIGKMAEGRELKDLVSVSVKPDSYEYGSPIPVVRYQDAIFSLIVTAPKANL